MTKTSLFLATVTAQREILNAQFPTLAFHFFSAPTKPGIMRIRVMRATFESQHAYMKRGVPGSQFLEEEVNCEGFPDEAFLVKCMLIA